MKKWINMLAVAAVVVATMAVAAHAETTFPKGSKMARIVESGTIKIGVKYDQPGFGLRNLRGEPNGFDVEIGKIVAASMGIPEDKITWVETVSANREPFIQQDKVDLVVATYSMTDKRREVVGFAGPYFITGQDIIVKKGNPASIKGPNDLIGKKTCVVNGSEGRTAMVRDYPDAELVAFDSFTKCAEAVKSGSVDAASISAAILIGYVVKEPDALEMVGQPFTEEKLSIGIKKGDTEYCEFINQALRDANADGRYATAFDGTLGKLLNRPAEFPVLEACR